MLLFLFALNQETPGQCSRTGSQHNHPQNQIALVAGGGGARCGGRSGAGEGGSVDPLHVRVAGNLLGDNPSAAVAAVTCIGGGSVVVAAALAGIVAGVIGGRSRLNGEFRSRCAGIGNDSQCVLAHRQGFQIFGFQGDNGAAFLYGVVGSIQVFAVHLNLSEVFIGCIGVEGKTILGAFLPAAFCPGCDNGLEIRSNRAADSTFAVVIVVAGGRNVSKYLCLCRCQSVSKVAV